MIDKFDDEAEEQLDFWGSWKRFYLFIIVYAILQVFILYFFTRTFNHS